MGFKLQENKKFINSHKTKPLPALTNYSTLPLRDYNLSTQNNESFPSNKSLRAQSWDE